MKKAFEWGHCFKQDHFYTKPQEGVFVDERGKKKYLWMGAYGIGIGRSMACIVESHHDEKGIVWPKSIAPYQTHLLGIELKNSKVKKFAEKAYKELIDAGIEVLYDDREDVSAGVKFNDADLIGIPIRLIVSEKTKNMVEWKKRDSQKKELLNLEEVIKRLRGA